MLKVPSFADVHYYFGAPTPRPIAHRFDKGSYLYFYGNKDSNGGRLEIANNVGKPEQDAFTGCKRQSLSDKQQQLINFRMVAMNCTTIRQTDKHPTLCTITVDGYSSHGEGNTAPVHEPEHHWRLPNTDPRNEGKYPFRLHTLDIYFWTAEDANKFVAFARRKLDPAQLDDVDVPSAPEAHDQVMSPVVQNLENVAIQDPAYHHGQTRNSRTAPIGTTSPPNIGSPKDSSRLDIPKAQDTTMYQPLAYNPSAPPAPEPIRHREKTPPPVDADSGTGLAAAAHRDYTQAVSSQSSLSRPPGSQIQSSQGLFSPQPPQPHIQSYTSPSPSGGYATLPTSVQSHRTSSVSSFPPPPPRSGRGSVSPSKPTTSFAAPPQNTANAPSPHPQQNFPVFSAPPQDSVVPFYGKDNQPPESPATQILGDSYIAGTRQPLQHLQPQYADYEGLVGGYSNYQYSQQHLEQHQQHHGREGSEYDIHNQIYRPTVEEARGHKPVKTSGRQQAGRFEQGAGAVDKKVNRFFKKLEKRIG